MQNRQIIADLIKLHFENRALNFLNLGQIKLRLHAMVSDDEGVFLQLIQSYSLELLEIIKILLDNNAADAKRVLNAKQLIITSPVAIMINVENFIILSELKKAFKPHSQILLKSMYKDLKILSSIPTPTKRALSQVKLLETSNLELANLTIVETKLLNILEKFDKDMQILYQSPYSYLSQGLYRSVCGAMPVDTNEEEFKVFTKKILRSSIPSNSVFMLGTFKNSNAIIDQLYAMVRHPLQSVKKFTLEEDKKNQLLPEVTERKRVIRITFNAEIAKAILELTPFTLESYFKSAIEYTGQHQIISSDSEAALTITNNKKLLRTLTRKSSGLEQLKTCTIICRDMSQEELPKSTKFCKLTLINNDEYLITNAMIIHKITYLFHLLSLAEHTFKDTPAYLIAPSPTLSKSDLSLQFITASEDKSDLEKEIVAFQDIMQKEKVSFAIDTAWVAIREKAFALSLAPLQDEFNGFR